MMLTLDNYDTVLIPCECNKYGIMKKSTKFLVGGIFLIAIVLVAEPIFQSFGVGYGPMQIIGSCFAGLVGAIKLVS